VSRFQKGKTNLDITEARDSEWAICKSAPRSRQITMPAPHHSVFYRPDVLPAAQKFKAKSTHVHNASYNSLGGCRKALTTPPLLYIGKGKKQARIK